MAKAWTDKKEFQHLSGELASSSERDFENRALPLLRLIWPAAIGTPARKSFDQSGVDHLAWRDPPPFDLVVQCKGFGVSDIELGSSQIAQCKQSIAVYRKSKLRSKVYLLVHNRTGKNQDFRTAVEAEVKLLEASGQVDRAELWDRQRLLSEAFNKLLNTARNSVTSKNLSVAQAYADMEPKLCDPLRAVPLRICNLTADQYRLRDVSTPVERVADPLDELLRFGKGNLTVMIGEAGFGKTTAALRTFATGTRKVLYVPAAIISGSTHSAKDLLWQCLDVDRLIGDAEDSDRPTLRLMARPVIEYILKEKGSPLALILDGLDESVFLSRRGGIQCLFNSLRDVRVPVILTARTELWHGRIADFTTSFGPAGTSGELHNKKIRLIELLPWSEHQIISLVSRYRDTLREEGQRRRLDELADAVRSGDYSKYYGDIPKRPLFLRFILETVADEGIHAVNRSQLFYEWARMKILRDISHPMRWSVSGRAPIVSEREGADTALEIAFLAMKWAARRMTTTSEGSLELLPSCALQDVLASDRILERIEEPTGLFLNSLLAPVWPPLGKGPRMIRFVHRAYQEFFLALFLKEHPHEFGNLEIPPEIGQWLDDLGAHRGDVS